VSRIQLHIDGVVLRGFEGADAHVRKALVESLRAELARSLADPAMQVSLRKNSSMMKTPVLRVGEIAMLQGAAGARRMGVQIARAIGKGIAR